VLATAVFRRTFVGETFAPALGEAVERPELPLDADAFLLPAAANTAST
jgi:hypothetical protein